MNQADAETSCTKNYDLSSLRSLSQFPLSTHRRFAIFSFQEEFGKEIDSDLRVLFAGIALILIYTFLQLSMFKKGCVGLRFVSTAGGLLCIGLSIFASQGLCSYFGLFTSPLVSVLPFLLIGEWV